MVKRRYKYRRRRRKKETLAEVQSKTIWLIVFLCLLILFFFLSYNWERIIDNPFPFILWIVAVLLLIYLFFFLKKRKKEKYFSQRKTLQDLRKMDPYEFEELVALQVKKQWYTWVKVTAARKDGGYDLVAKSKWKVYIIQCKRYSEKNKIPVDEVRAISWVAKQLSPKYIWMIVTTWFLSRDALKEAQNYNVLVRDWNNIVEKLGL